MNKTTRTLVAAAAATLCTGLWATVGQAVVPGPALVAMGSISAFYEDFATDTAAPLENGVRGNRLGGIGSGLAYAGDDSFVGLPDRGPNAVAYNPCLDDTASYIPRFHALHLSLSPSDAGVTLPLTLTPMLVDTTLFSSRGSLAYGPGCGAAGNGEPALNQIDHTHYFSGRSDNFDPSVMNSTNPRNGRLDPEGIRVSNDGHSVYITDEYGPYVYEFDRETGRRTRIYSLPAKFAILNQSSSSADEFTNTSGRVTNKGMEGLAITPDGRTLVGAMQKPLIQDGGDVQGGITRIVTIDIRTGAVHEYAYQLDNDKNTSISEILAINNTDFLVDERDGKGLGDDSKAVAKRIYRISLTGAVEVSGFSGAANLTGKTVAKSLFLDIVSVLTTSGVGLTDRLIPAKLEGIAFGQDVTVGGVLKHTLFVSNDNDYTPVTSVQGTPTPNPNQFFVFGFTDAELPGLVKQRFFCPEHDSHDWDRRHDGDGHGRNGNDHDGDGRGGRGGDRQ